MPLPSISIQGLRCFRERVRIPLGPELVALVGLNNAGKSSLLRLIWELRPLFGRLAADGFVQFGSTNAVVAGWECADNVVPNRHSSSFRRPARRAGLVVSANGVPLTVVFRLVRPWPCAVTRVRAVDFSQ
jgi:recombinational DNA repair ATPase RecF